MARILTVDDSRAIRTIVSKQVVEMGHDVEEAEDGLKGLAALEECVYDLVVLDVTMPELDGPGMLKRMREAGDKTPVVMLTSESKRSTIADCMKLGISDYILKPFKPEELRAKVIKVLGPGTGPRAEAATPAAAAPVVAGAPAPQGGLGAGRQFIDVLLIDDMENVHKKLRGLLPQHFSMNACGSAQSALSMCRERIYRVIVLDIDIPDVDAAVLLGQLRLLQPSAAAIALVLRTTNDASAEMRGLGFDDILMKPFDQTSIEDFLLRFFDNQEVLHVEDNVLRAGAFTGKDDKIERYVRRLAGLIVPAVAKIAAACYDDAIFDLHEVPARSEHLPKLVAEIEKKARAAGIALRLVGTADHARVLSTIAETSSLPFFESLGAARAA